MTTEELVKRNAAFAADRFPEHLSPIPRMKTVLITCADHRVDPAHTLGLELGDAAVVRNAGGRITPATLQSVALMAAVVAEEGGGGGFEVIILQHTDCGLARLAQYEDLLAGYFGIGTDEVAAKHVADPSAAVRADVELLRTNPMLPDDLRVSGLVYDVETGLAETVVLPAPLRSG